MTKETIKMKKILSINSDESFCDCCGKSNLKRVVWIEDTETGNVNHYGTVCAENVLSWKTYEKVRKTISLINKLDKYKKMNRMDFIFSLRSAIIKSDLKEYRELCNRYVKAFEDGNEKDFKI